MDKKQIVRALEKHLKTKVFHRPDLDHYIGEKGKKGRKLIKGMRFINGWGAGENKAFREAIAIVESMPPLVKCLPDEKCLVLNYRMKPAQWEHAKVYNVDIRVNRDGATSNHYRVCLDRRTTTRSRGFPDGGAVIILTVDDDSIQSLKKKKR